MYIIQLKIKTILKLGYTYLKIISQFPERFLRKDLRQMFGQRVGQRLVGQLVGGVSRDPAGQRETRCQERGRQRGEHTQE